MKTLEFMIQDTVQQTRFQKYLNKHYDAEDDAREDSEEEMANLIDDSEELSMFENESQPTSHQRREGSNSRLQKVPSVWLRRCPLEKIAKNIKLITEFQKNEQFPKVFPLEPEEKKNFMTLTQAELFTYRANVARFIIQKEQRKLNIGNFRSNTPFTVYYENKKPDQYPENFKTTAETVMNQTCRKLQLFIINYFNLNIIGLSRVQYRQTISLLINCSKYFNNDFCETLFNFMRMTYQLGNLTLSSILQVTRFYKTIQLAVKIRASKKLQAIAKRKGEDKLFTFRQLTVKTSLKHIWNYEYQRLLLKTYKANPHFGYIKEQFQFKYPQYSGIFTSNQLKDRFCSIIRATLRMIRDRIKSKKDESIPRLFGLNEKRFKQITKTKRGQGIRVWLIDIYMRQDVPDEQIYSIVTVMNNFIESKEQYSLITSQISTTSRANDSYFTDELEQSSKQDQLNQMEVRSVPQNSLYFEEEDNDKRSQMGSKVKKSSRSKRKKKEIGSNERTYSRSRQTSSASEGYE